MKLMTRGPALPGQERLYLVCCPGCGQSIRVGERRRYNKDGRPGWTTIDRCPDCGLHIELVRLEDVGA